MSFSNSSAVNVGELLRRGVVLEAREAVAIVYQVCRQTMPARSRVPASPDALWIDGSGALSTAEPDSTPTTPGAASAIAILLDKLLPPRNRPEYPVPSSLRSLSIRLRAVAEAGGTANANDLLTILRLHLDEDAGQVLRHLFIRVQPVPPAGEQAPPAPETAPAGNAAMPRTSVARGSSEDGFGAFATESGHQGVVHGGPVLNRDPDVFRLDAPDPVPMNRVRRPMGIAAQVVAALALVMVAGYVGYEFGRIPAGDSSQTVTGTAQPHPQAANGAAQTGGQPTPEPPAPTAAPTAADRTPPGAPGRRADSDRIAAAPHPLMLAVGTEAFSPSFDPAGGKLLFHSGRTGTSRLFEADLDQRGEPSRIVPLLATSLPFAARDYHARLSPDARRIAFDSDRDGKRGVYISNPDGSQATRLSGDGFAAVPSWSPDMKWLSFIRAEPDRPRVWNLWLLNLASGTLSRQTSFRVGQVWGASWFPDSRQVCYSHEDRLIVTNIASGASKSFRTPRPGHLVRTPAVAPDGKRIIFQVFRDGVWLLDLPTRSMRRILDDDTAEEFAWDPEGRRIAYHSRHDGTWRIWIATVSAPS